jgi:hypothetical protein
MKVVEATESIDHPLALRARTIALTLSPASSKYGVSQSTLIGT